MRVGLIVDSACDLPYWFSRRNSLFVLPVTARIDDQTYVDDHDPDRTQHFYDSGLLERATTPRPNPSRPRIFTSCSWKRS